MPIEIKITGENHSQAVSELLGLVRNLNADTNVSAGTVASAELQKPVPEAAPAPLVSTRLPTAAPETAPTPIPEPTEAPAPKAKGKAKPAVIVEKPAAPKLERPTVQEGTLDCARQWIKFVDQEKGLPKAAEIITSFGVKRVLDITGEDKLSDFVAKCVQALDGATDTSVASMM